MTYSDKRAARCVLTLLLLCAVSGCVQHRFVAAGPPRETPRATTSPAGETLPAPEALLADAHEPVVDAPAPVQGAPEPDPGTAQPATDAPAPVQGAPEPDPGTQQLISETPGPVQGSPEMDPGTAQPATDAPEPPPRQEVAILFNRDEPRFAEVVDQLVPLLPRDEYWLTLADIENEDSLRVARTLRGRPGLIVFAVGLPAARFARDELSAPTVFAHVFNYRELIVDGRAMHGVTAMPPLDLQARDWKRFDPELRRVALIVSEQYTELIPAARSAAEAAGLTFESETSSSDQETLYLFRRLAPRIDGLWLVPDDGILSPAVLGELFDYAASHNVGVSVFADALLDWGALLSASGTADEIARRMHQILERVIAGEADSLPRLSPLSDVAVRINPEVADRLGLALTRGESWIVRGQQ